MFMFNIRMSYIVANINEYDTNPQNQKLIHPEIFIEDRTNII